MIYFDVANTLLHKPDLFPNIRKALLAHNIDINEKDIAKTHKAVSELIKFPDKTSSEFYRHFNTELLFALGVIPNDKLVGDIFEACKYLPWSAFEDISALSRLPGPLGIISNWDRTLPEKLEEFVEVEFHPIIGSEEFGTSKPHPSIFEAAIEKSGKKASELMYIGDSIKLDMKEALRQGIRAVLIDRDDVYPNYQGERIKSLTEIDQLI